LPRRPTKGVVKAIVKGTGEVLSVTFEPAALDPDDPEMAGDLAVAALNQAFGAMSADAEGSLGGAAGDMGLGGTGLGGMLG